MAVSLRRGVLETVQLQRKVSLDAQGKPTFGSSIEILAKVRREDKLLQPPGGENFESSAMVWIDADEDLPAIDDRLILADGFRGIVKELSEVRMASSGTVSHVRVKLLKTNG